MVALERSAVRAAARQTLGVRSLLPGQAEAVASITAGRDTLVLLPTGGGKSAVYQLAGVAIDGPSVVVSPLVALQQDQLESLAELDLPAAVVNSTRPAGERADTLAAFEHGDIEFLMLSPESLADPAVARALAAGKPSLLVVDEAHCVAEWGRDFRPEYRRVAAAAEALGRPPILALTATASPLVRTEIVERLGLRDPAIIARGFDRPNIDLSVEQHADADAKRRALVAAVTEAPKPGIVYTATRAAADGLAASLVEAGVDARAYHAGLPSKRRAAIQDRFMASSDGVIVATIAFGMGIDKPDIRFVYHLDVSESLDAYHQEIGRAGRDGDPAEARLFYRPQDLGLRRFQAAPPRFDEEDVRAVLRALRRSASPPDVMALAKQAGRSRRRADAVVGRLEDAGAVTVAADGTIAEAAHDTKALGAEPIADDQHRAGEARLDPDALAVAAVASQERRRAVERSRVEMIRGYAEAPGCRRAFLLGYFGEAFQPPCGACDRCRALEAQGRTAELVEATTVPTPFSVNDRVRHPHFGPGVVTGIEPDRVTVAFDDVGYRTLALSVADDGLLTPEPA